MTAPRLDVVRQWFGRCFGLTSEQDTYDYRRHWVDLAARLSAAETPETIAREMVDHIVRSGAATSAGVYLSEAGTTAYRLVAGVGAAAFTLSIEDRTDLPSWLRMSNSAVVLPRTCLPSITTPPLPAALGVAIRWRTSLLGFLVLGPRRSGADHTAEDAEFLTALANQAATALAAVRTPEREAQPPRIERMDRFTAAVIHDLKNAVSALSMLARNAAGNFADPEFQRDAVTTLSRTVERMRRLLVKLASTDEAAPATPNEPIDLEALIMEATKPLASDTKVRLVRRLRPVTTVYGDRDALLRVVENLTTNAAEAIDREGTVTVTLAEEAGRAVISVADTGHGMSEDYQERHLFSPFRSTKKGGWGIGLYQTKQVVENQDGEILVESVEGHGTTFTVKLPLRVDAESPSLESVR